VPQVMTLGHDWCGLVGRIFEPEFEHKGVHVFVEGRGLYCSDPLEHYRLPLTFHGKAVEAIDMAELFCYVNVIGEYAGVKLLAVPVYGPGFPAREDLEFLQAFRGIRNLVLPGSPGIQSFFSRD